MFKVAFLVAAVFALIVVASASQQDKNPLGCSVCQLVLQFVEAQATSNASITKINALVTKVCSALRVQDWCDKNVLPLIPDLLNNITAKENPQKVCQQIKLCDPVVIRAIRPPKQNPVKPAANPLACGLCQGIVNVIEQQAQSNWTVTQVDNAIMRVCTRLRVGDWCQQNVIPRVQEVIALILSRAPADKICAKIKLCDPAQMDQDEAVEAAAFDLRCSLCETVITAARTTAGEDKTQAGISRALQSACARVSFAREICNSVLAPLVQKIAQDLINNVNTHKVCENVKMCKP